jgi:hypothetical protein
LLVPHAAASATTGNSENRFVSTASQFDTLKVATVVQKIMTELTKAVSQKDKIMVIIKMVFNLMKQNGC